MKSLSVISQFKSFKTRFLHLENYILLEHVRKALSKIIFIPIYVHNQHGDKGILSSRPGAAHGEASWACKPHGRLPEPTLPPALGPFSLRPARGYYEGGCPAGHTLYPAGDGPLTGRAPHPGGGLQSRASDRHTTLPSRLAEATSHHARWKGDRGRGFPGPLHAPPSAANIP